MQALNYYKALVITLNKMHSYRARYLWIIRCTSGPYASATTNENLQQFIHRNRHYLPSVARVCYLLRGNGRHAEPRRITSTTCPRLVASESTNLSPLLRDTSEAGKQSD